MPPLSPFVKFCRRGQAITARLPPGVGGSQNSESGLLRGHSLRKRARQPLTPVAARPREPWTLLWQMRAVRDIACRPAITLASGEKKPDWCKLMWPFSLGTDIEATKARTVGQEPLRPRTRN